MTVYLVGAGPGDPGLVTVRGAELLAAADVVLHDRLVDRRLLGLVRPDATVIDVGKRAGGDPGPSSQEEVNRLLVDHGARSAVVVRLKGGDPFVFGRGGEEALELERAGLAYEVVPGVSAAFAAAAAAGTPVTHRGLSAAVTVLSGHDVASSAALDHVVASGATIVVLMGAATRDAVAGRFLEAGLARSTPVLVVERATFATQRSFRIRLDELAAAEIASPATIVIGGVAAMHLAGYEDRPLAGRRVVVTRASGQSAGLAGLLRAAGAEVVELPVIATTAPDDGGAALAAACDRLGGYAWVVLSSANAVEALFSHLRDTRSLGTARVAAIGSATAAALACRGVVADLVPERFVGESLAEAFPHPVTGESRAVLLPRAAVARDVVPEGLAALGWRVEVVDAYRTVHPAPAPGALDALGGADVVTFTSSSTITGFLALAGRERLPGLVASIGPVTSATARRAGIAVDVEATEHSATGLVAALVAHLAGR